MIKYRLICTGQHEFDGWFSSSAEYDVQAEKHLINCPYCNSAEISKALMTPSVSTSRKKQKRQDDRRRARAMMHKAAAKIRAEIEETCDDVGDSFASEARAIHYGETEARQIYGTATETETAELTEEGIGIAPLPDIFVPKPKKSQH